jgi:hypothetical protein
MVDDDNGFMVDDDDDGLMIDGLWYWFNDNGS